jgi:Glycosyltransferase
MYKVLCIVQIPVPSTEISIIKPFNYLQQQQEIAWQMVREAAFKPEMLEQVDIVIFHRNCHPNCQSILDAVKVTPIPIIYEIDDNYFELPEELPVGRYMRIPNVVKMVESLLNSADIIKVGSPEFNHHFSKYNQNIFYHPYAVDLNILNGIAPRESSIFTIGYAGTIYHDLDLKLIADPILQIAEKFPAIQWDFIGCLPEGFKNLPNHTFTPFIPNYDEFLQEIYRRKWQIGLSPLRDMPHNRCKTDNKLREYSACRIAGIYSDIPPFATNVKNGETGLLVENTEQAWYEALKGLIHDQHLRNKIADQARKWIEEQRSIPVIAKLWMELFEQAIKTKELS